MSMPTHFNQRSSARMEVKEDCRDYLRTGRCKYGASCKYNHPPNVQSGGGMKGPINPSEPMFPIRPNEPVCSYYMKHGTCKFGQMCKFHHPPLTCSTATTPPLLQVSHKSDLPQWNASADPRISMLPQRPDEPKCIYFLKNGRCKYGASCRYHHPLNYHTRKQPQDDDRRVHMAPTAGPSESVGQAKLHYVSLPPGTYQQGHFVVADGQLAFLSIDGSSQGQVISVPQVSNQDAPVIFTTSGSKASLNRDVGSSTSSTSIASFESSIIGSGGSLNTFSVDQNGQGRPAVLSNGRPVIMQNAHEGVQNLPRVVSTGSQMEGSPVYYEAGPKHKHGPAVHGASWREQRSSSFDHTRRMASQPAHGGLRESASVPTFATPNEDSTTQGQGRQFENQRSPMTGRRPGSSTNTPKMRHGRVDDGLSMMTSALLTMLDTPEEGGSANPDQEQEYNETAVPMTNTQQIQRSDGPELYGQYGPNVHAQQFLPREQAFQGATYDSDQYGSEEMYANFSGQPNGGYQRWSPSPQQESEQRSDSLFHQGSHTLIDGDSSHQTSSTQYEASNVGLYFP